MLDLFSGIGGFHKGFEQAGYEFDWVGFSEIDKYASAVYRHRFPEAVELGDITAIQPGRDLPDHIDIICGGFPCQSFSMAGKRKGFDDTRGTLFFEIARLLRHYRDAKSPIDYFVLENVKGLLSHDNGRTFATIYGVLSDLGYTVEFQLLNTRWWLPQNRERIYLVGYIGDRSGSKVFPIGEDGGTYNVNQTRTKSKTELCTAITTREGGRKENNFVIVDKQMQKKNNQHYAANLSGGGHSGGNHSDMDLIKIADYRNDEGLRIRKDGNSPTLMTVKHSETEPSMMPPLLVPEATKKGYAEAEEGDSINLSVPNSKTRRGRVGKGEAQTLDTGMQQYTIQPVLTPNRAEKRQNGRRFKEDGEPMFTLTGQDQHGVMVKQYGYKQLDETLQQNDLKKDDVKALDLYNRKAQDNCPPLANAHHMPKLYERNKIRRLTPVECCRLQGFPDDWNEYGEFDGEVKPMSDTQRYKQCGNAVTVNVVQAVAERLKINKG
jgi:DNA (cytosine-5)-methyltransferase 1